ncbi:hypothetical protein PAL_GLEAN10015775 [Pteropus alecto]|uniref:Uncharacterized protein n=1 Tax=Pteropus alecto TaxID=9402 RepID=L5KZX5_PTEAL|nr:hypothetical protein PAL_GLEAN10015775 [Pteropus alecto]
MEPVLTVGNDAEEGADVGVLTGQGLVIEKFQSMTERRAKIIQDIILRVEQKHEDVLTELCPGLCYLSDSSVFRVE